MLILTIAVLMVTNANAQRFSHDIGASLSMVCWKEKTVFGYSIGEEIVETKNASVIYPMLTYSPRYDFVQMKNSTVSVSAPVSLGGGLARNYATDDMGFAFTFDLPLVVDYNFGQGSHPENDSRMGGYFGGGFSYQYFSISESINSDIKNKTYGAPCPGRCPFLKNGDGFVFSPGA
jgi:hypothetical protein